MIVQVLWVCIALLLIIAALEVFSPQTLNEGFATLMNVGDSSFWSLHMPRRGDISYNAKDEEGGYIRDSRYFADYVDIQNIGVKHDFCRMVQPKGSKDEDKFFACALGGTAGLSSVSFKTQTIKQGFQISRDDYMNMTPNKTLGYCRILKLTEFQTPFQAICTPSMPNGFKSSVLDTQDAKPPDQIQTLLNFYQGILFWLRFIDDMVDYAQNLTILGAGSIGVVETPPKPDRARTLTFDGASQFLKVGDSGDMAFGSHIDLRYLRTVCFWVYFDEFTNNAHIFDFGNGAGKDNVFMGIVGRGNENAVMNPIQLGCKLENESTVPASPSGAQNVDETTPENLMKTTSANVNDFDCPSLEVYGQTFPPVQPFAMPQFKAKTADLLYEVWDSQQRKLHVQLKDVIPIQKWTHICLTTVNFDAARPTLRFYVNNVLVNVEVAAWLPQTSTLKSNYIGKSNWSNVTSNESNPDEFFKGKLFDFRGYKVPMTATTLKATYDWGQTYLGLKEAKAEAEAQS
jgi:hypothetical protein